MFPFAVSSIFFTVFAHAEDDFCNYEHLSTKSCHCCQEELLLCCILDIFMRVFQCEWKDARVGGQLAAVVWVWSTPWHSSTTRGPGSLLCAGPGFMNGFVGPAAVGERAGRDACPRFGGSSHCTASPCQLRGCSLPVDTAAPPACASGGFRAVAPDFFINNYIL